MFVAIYYFTIFIFKLILLNILFIHLLKKVEPKHYIYPPFEKGGAKTLYLSTF